MIHVLTVHWKDDRWIDIQLEYLNKYISEPFKVYSFLNYLPSFHHSKFFYCSTENIQSHEVKLNLLADMATLHSQDENDWLMFIDGDAFPIGDVVSFGKDKLGKWPLAAIQRKENHGDIQPHPSFCLTTVKFWKEICGTWASGYQWENSYGKAVTDVGGNLLAILNSQGHDWFSLLRSNKKDLHPLWFGIYDDIIYHHGAGFRKAISRIDLETNNIRHDYSHSMYFKLIHKLPDTIQQWFSLMRKLNKISQKNNFLVDSVYKSILEDPFFYNCFQ